MLVDGRQQRLDVLRGLALLFMFIDHLEGAVGASLVSPWTLHGWYWCDAAEVFIFLSGLVCGKVYLPVLNRQGFFACQQKAMRRAAQLYVANLACLLVMIDAVMMLGPPSGATFHQLQYEGMERGLGPLAVMSLLMLYQPMAVDVLTLYIQFVALLPVMLLCWRHWPSLTKVICLVAYLASQYFTCLNVPRWPFDVFPDIGCGRHFHHVAWNALFFLGVLTAIDPWPIRGRALRRALFGACLAGVLIVILSRFPAVSEWLPLLHNMETWNPSDSATKMTLGPIRLLAFLMLAYVVSNIVTEDRCRRLKRPLAPLTLLGRNSLQVYCVTLLLAHLSWLFVSSEVASQNIVPLLTYEAFGCLAMFLTASAWERFRARRRVGSGPARFAAITGADVGAPSN